MSMEHRASISECGLYVAVVSGHDLHIHSISSSLDSGFRTPIHHDLTNIFFKHSKSIRRTDYKPKISVNIVQWESLNTTMSSKVALCASDGTSHLVLIFSLDGEHPIVIEADSNGVEKLQWLPLYPKEISAYSNCTLLAVFTKFGLELRVYSITHTYMLFSVPKPLINEFFVRPGNSGIWSVITSPYYEKNASQSAILQSTNSLWPTLLQIHTNNGACSLLASLKLDFDPSTLAQFSWSSSGKWLMYFDTFNALNCPKLSVFNALGVHDTPIGNATHYESQPTRKLDFHPSSKEIDFFGLSPRAMWGNLQSIEYIIVTPTSSKDILRLRVSDISNMFKSVTVEIDLDSSVIWNHSLQSEQEHRYKKVKHLPSMPTHEWSKTMSFGSSHLLATDNLVVIFESVFKNKLEFHIVAVIMSNSQILEAKELKNGSHILAFIDHISLRTPAGMEVVYSSSTRLSQVKMIEENDELKISIVETSASGLKWKHFVHTLKSEHVSALDLAENTSQKEETLAKRHIFTHPKEGGRKIERPFPSARPGTSSDSSTIGEEITDTFQAQKRRRQ